MANSLEQAFFFQLVQSVAEGRSDFVELVRALQPYLHQLQPMSAEVALQLSTAMHELHGLIEEQEGWRHLLAPYPVPALLVNASGLVLALNPEAGQLDLPRVGSDLAALGLSAPQYQELWQQFRNQPEPRLLSLTHQTKTIMMLASLQPQSGALLLLMLQQSWPPSVDLAMRELFKLSAAETQVLSCLAAGQTPEQMALELGKSKGTIRQQVKQLLAKFGASSQVQLAALASAAANALAPVPVGAQQPRLAEGLQLQQFSRAERTVGWRFFGQPQGEPILMLHGPSFAAGEFDHDRQLARHHGLAVYAIERLGYGRTQVAEQQQELQSQVDDLLALMDLCGLERVTLFSHECALIPALALAQQAPERVKSILSVSAAPPFVRLEQLRQMPEQQGVFILAAKQSRWLAKLLLRLLVLRLQQLGSQSWYQAVFADIDFELAQTQRPELQAGVAAAYAFYTQQQGAGFESDLQLMIQDWQSLVRDCPVPLRLMHGSRNPSTLVSDLTIFQQLKPDLTIELMADAGLTLALSHAERLYQALARQAKGQR